MASKKQKRARAHHVLPQFYLRAWANANDAVAMLTREGKEIVTGTAALAVENDFYTVTDPKSGEESSIVEEGLLKQWDGEGAAVHSRLLEDDFPLDEDSRMRFALWLGLQYVRGRRSRQVGQEMHDLLLKQLVTMGIGDHDTGPAPDSTMSGPPTGVGSGAEVPDLRHLPDETKVVLRNTDEYQFELPREQSIHQMVSSVPDVAKPLIEADWWLMRLDQGALLTSDEPISLYREPSPQNMHLGVGVATADAVVCPLSPRRCLLMIRSQMGDRIVDGPAAAAQDFNEMLIRGHWRQLFRHPDGPAFPDPPPLPERFVEVV
jgi:hypothetical protein